MGKFTSAAHTPQLEVHELTTADPTTTIPILEGLVRRAEITLDSANNRLIVLAPPDAQLTIRNTLAQLQSTDPGANDPQVRVINLKQKASQALSEVLAQLVPDANVTIDEEGKRLVVVATEADHEVVERTVQQIDGALSEEEENALMVYPVSPGQRKRFEAVVESLGEDLPNVKVIDDDEPTQVSVWAKPSRAQGDRRDSHAVEGRCIRGDAEAFRGVFHSGRRGIRDVAERPIDDGYDADDGP